MNCKNLIISSSTSPSLSSIIPQYLSQFSHVFNILNIDKQHQMVLVPQGQFVSKVLGEVGNVGVYIGESGITEFNSLNRYVGIRAAIINNTYLAQMCRKHNDANIVIISTDCIASKLAGQLVKNYLMSAFDHNQNNVIRVLKLKQLEKKYLYN